MIAYIVGPILGLVARLLFTGLLLPAEITVSGSIIIDQSAGPK